MNLIDQVGAAKSLNEALVPGPSLIDGRTEQDRLSFLANFASLINFYDKNNTVHGNWTPFLLKDPVILLASISKTSFTGYYSLYLNTCIKLEQLLVRDVVTRGLATAMNLVFDQLTDIFMLIERWTYYMQGDDEKYDLKTYVLHQVKSNFSAYFWALVALRQNLSISYAAFGMEPPQTYLFQSFDKIIWKQNKDKSPYWEIFNLYYPVKSKKNTPKVLFHAVKKVGDELFDFFRAIIEHANVEFEKVKSIRCKYPDTTLLRTFVNLLSIQQQQLNTISQKHLRFYYHDILKQSALPASADSAIICAELAKPDATFNLPAGTLFNAGIDEKKDPVFFSSTENVELNTAAITGAYTINQLQDATPDGFTSLYLNQVPDPGIINKDKDGKIKYWDTFGSQTAAAESLVKQGIAFASPMLLLREGKRTVRFFLTYTGEINIQMLRAASCYLSTRESWLYIKNEFIKVSALYMDDIDPLKDKSVVIEITLTSAEPPIESFTVNPDGLDSKWPMVKIQFASFSDLAAPPVLTSLKIEVTVSDVKTFQLYNDNGALSTKTPYHMFGPIPMVNSSFIIGNNEIFSKPLDALYIELDWDKLPDDFEDYYQVYNRYINHGLDPALPIDQAEEKPKKKWFLCWRKPASKDDIVVEKYVTPFNNYCFTVDFDLLQDGTWKYFDLSKRESITVTDDNQISAPDYDNKKCGELKSRLLFSTDDNCHITGQSFFAYPVLVNENSPGNEVPVADPRKADANIQNDPFNFTDVSASGFMRMALTGPPEGFGSEVYPKVVSQIALYNSWVIYKQESPDLFVQPANLPFAPKAVNFIADYTASTTYDLTWVTGHYPIQCYLYGAFSNFKAYDNSSVTANYSYAGNKQGTEEAASGVPLYPRFNYTGCLFMQMENLVPASSMNLYFELTRKFIAGLPGEGIDYCYLSTTGWKALTVLSDGTNKFNCSGIIKVVVPYDITNESTLMPDKKYWFYIGTNGNSSTSPKTVFLKTNGFNVQRSGTSFLTETRVPELAANTITGPQTAIPQIATIVQPFPSYGGRAAETDLIMNQRVSNRLKTKERAVNAADYYTLISQEFNDIYYAKAVFDSGSQNTNVYVVKTYQSWADPNAFAPQADACTIDAVQSFLQDRASKFARIVVSNFDLFPINITATVIIKKEFFSELRQVHDNIVQALDIYLSPWIRSTGQQLVIDQEITNAQLAKFIQSLEGVQEVQDISFLPAYIGKTITGATLFVSGMDHTVDLKCNPQ